MDYLKILNTYENSSRFYVLVLSITFDHLINYTVLLLCIGKMMLNETELCFSKIL